jgi:hypothetical protein
VAGDKAGLFLENENKKDTFLDTCTVFAKIAADDPNTNSLHHH